MDCDVIDCADIDGVVIDYDDIDGVVIHSAVL